MSTRRNTGRDRRLPPAPVGAQVIDLSGAIAEYNFLAANVTKDGSSNITQVNDLSGNARHLTQGVTANSPTWSSAALNGQDVGVFNMAATTLKRVLKTTMGTFSNFKWTMALVTKCDVVPGLNLLEGGALWQNSANGRGGLALGYFSTTATRTVRTVRNSDGTTQDTTFGNATVGSWEKWVVTVDGAADDGTATISVWLNGSLAATAGAAGFSSSVTANGFASLGGGSSTGSPNFSEAYMKIWPRALNAVSVASLNALLLTTYGV